MIVARTIAEVRRAVRGARDQGERIGLVPTMGALHLGHLSLIDVARRSRASFVVVSIFVNPTQFGPGEDFHNYPRDEEGDAQKLREKQVDLLFLPSLEMMYPPGATTRLSAGSVSQPLEGEHRPGHFDGVATVVAKLFNIVEPDLAVFGRKDAQQCAVVHQIARDLDFPVELYFGETVREPDGLALSSRNAYLSPEERAIAPSLYQALLAGRNALTGGNRDPEQVERIMRETVRRRGVEIDYLSLVDAETFRPPADLRRDLLLVGAIRVGKTRLIDNLAVPRGELKR